MKREQLNYIIPKNCILKDFLNEVLSRKLYKSLKRRNVIYYINGLESKNYFEVLLNDKLIIEYDSDTLNNEWPKSKVIPEIIYEDQNIMVVYKVAPLLTIPTHNLDDSLYQQIVLYFEMSKIDATIHFINRLDKETEGLVLVAKNKHTAHLLNDNKVNITRKYKAILKGILLSKQGRINLAIKKDENSTKRYISSDGKESITNYKVLKEYDDYSLVEFHLETGRTHQIRVHSLSMGHPIYGDDLYGSFSVPDLHLCSYYLEFTNPYNNELLKFETKPRWNDFEE